MAKSLIQHRASQAAINKKSCWQNGLPPIPAILLLDEPTRGVDVGAKAEIYTILKNLAAQGMSMIVVSSELPELITLADRMLVMAGHQIQGSLMPEEFHQEAILKLAYGQL